MSFGSLWQSIIVLSIGSLYVVLNYSSKRGSFSNICLLVLLNSNLYFDFLCMIFPLEVSLSITSMCSLQGSHVYQFSQLSSFPSCLRIVFLFGCYNFDSQLSLSSHTINMNWVPTYRIESEFILINSLYCILHDY